MFIPKEVSVVDNIVVVFVVLGAVNVAGSILNMVGVMLIIVVGPFCVLFD